MREFILILLESVISVVLLLILDIVTNTLISCLNTFVGYIIAMNRTDNNKNTSESDNKNNKGSNYGKGPKRYTGYFSTRHSDD